MMAMNGEMTPADRYINEIYYRIIDRNTDFSQATFNFIRNHLEDAVSLLQQRNFYAHYPVMEPFTVYSYLNTPTGSPNEGHGGAEQSGKMVFKYIVLLNSISILICEFNFPGRVPAGNRRALANYFDLLCTYVLFAQGETEFLNHRSCLLAIAARLEAPLILVNAWLAADEI